MPRGSDVTGKMTSNCPSLGLLEGVNSVRRQKCVHHEQQKFISKSNYTPTTEGADPREGSSLEQQVG